MPFFVAAIFLSAFLLFQVQPVIARYILPWYGGSPAVWTTCLLFFQVGLLGGYAYAHGLVSVLRGSRKWQVGVHLGLLGLALLILPITPSDTLKPGSEDNDPVWGIVRLLASTVGFPYLLLSASGPLLQHWFGQAFPTRSPYRLYAVSNLGSMLGLLTYPFLFEPLFTVSKQTAIWSLAFAIYCLFAACCGVLFLRNQAARKANEAGPVVEKDPTPLIDKLLWIAFPACGSILLLALTSQMCQDVAVVPFLWVVPLSLYLLTFVIAFDHDRWYLRTVVIPLAAISVGLVVTLLHREFADSEMFILSQIAIYCLAIFFCCLVCHGETARAKPPSHFLTKFYLCISLGGAMGGLFVSLLAPRLFNGYWELHLAFAILALLVTLQLYRWFTNQERARWHYAIGLGWVALLVVLAISLQGHMDSRRADALAATRGFYGTLHVYEENAGTDDYFRALYHGRISHGRQYFDERYKDLATTYYNEESGVGGFFKLFPNTSEEDPQPLHIGTIGLGVGTIATYARKIDRFRFYEINPQVEDMARKHFTYLADCDGEETVVIGDGRISLERELAAGAPQQFDALFVDAFSGDSIPIHLLTKEAFELYFQHLKPEGVLAVHITNLHLDLSDPVRNLANDFGREAIRVEYISDDETYHTYYSDWILITKNQEFLAELEAHGYQSDWERETPKNIHWTDNYSNLLEVLAE